MLLGRRVRDPVPGAALGLRDERVQVGAPITPPGRWEDLPAWPREHYPVLAMHRS